MRLWCVQYTTHQGTGWPQDVDSVIYVHACGDHECSGLGHTAPGHARHIWARSPAGAIARIVGVNRSTAWRWLREGRRARLVTG